MPSSPGRKYRRSTKYEVVFPTIPSLTIQPGEADLYQQFGSHDILELTFIRMSKLWQRYLKTGTPIVFNWSSGGYTNSFVGYVTHVKGHDAVQERRELKVIAASATYVLKERATRTWTNKSITDVALKIAKEFGFNLDTEPSKRKFEQLSITGESYWEWLREKGNRIGYALTCKGTDLTLRPIDKILNDSTFNSPVMSIGEKLTSANVLANDRTLDFFEVDKSDYHETNNNLFAKKNISGVNPLTSKRITKIADPAAGDSTRSIKARTNFTEFSTEVVRSDVFAKATAKDSASNSGMFFPAKARGQGDPRISPLQAVHVIGTGTETDGFWAVDSVHHSFNITGLYEVDMKLRTDGIGENSDSPFRKAASDTSNTINVEQKLLQQSLRTRTQSGKTSLESKLRPLREADASFDLNNSTWRKS